MIQQTLSNSNINNNTIFHMTDSETCCKTNIYTSTFLALTGDFAFQQLCFCSRVTGKCFHRITDFLKLQQIEVKKKSISVRAFFNSKPRIFSL